MRLGATSPARSGLWSSECRWTVGWDRVGGALVVWPLSGSLDPCWISGYYALQSVRWRQRCQWRSADAKASSTAVSSSATTRSVRGTRRYHVHPLRAAAGAGAAAPRRTAPRRTAPRSHISYVYSIMLLVVTHNRSHNQPHRIAFTHTALIFASASAAALSRCSTLPCASYDL
jgi:hypothetical protein